MDITNVITAISTVGFPIVGCIALFVAMYRQNENHKNEMNELKEAINNNTLALTKLSDKIEFNGGAK